MTFSSNHITRVLLPLHDAVLEGSVANVMALLARNETNINQQDPTSGTTALISAINTSNLALMDLLLSNGADPYLKDNQGNDALYYAKEILNLTEDDAAQQVFDTLNKLKEKTTDLPSDNTGHLERKLEKVTKELEQLKEAEKQRREEGEQKQLETFRICLKHKLIAALAIYNGLASGEIKKADEGSFKKTVENISRVAAVGGAVIGNPYVVAAAAFLPYLVEKLDGMLKNNKLEEIKRVADFAKISGGILEVKTEQFLEDISKTLSDSFQYQIFQLTDDGINDFAQAVTSIILDGIAKNWNVDLRSPTTRISNGKTSSPDLLSRKELVYSSIFSWEPFSSFSYYVGNVRYKRLDTIDTNKKWNVENLITMCGIKDDFGAVYQDPKEPALQYGCRKLLPFEKARRKNLKIISGVTISETQASSSQASSGSKQGLFSGTAPASYQSFQNEQQRPLLNDLDIDSGKKKGSSCCLIS